MVLHDDIAKLEKTLDPSAQVIVKLLRETIQAQQKALAESAKREKAQRLQIAALTQRITELTASVKDFQRMIFGRSSEKLPRIETEVRRRLEEEEIQAAALAAAAAAAGATPEPVTPPSEEERAAQRRKKGRATSETARKAKRKLRKDLPVLVERVLVTPDQLPEGYSLEDLREVSKTGEANVIYRIDHVREHLVRVEYRLQTLASKDNEIIITAKAPPSVTEGSHYDAGVYANVVVSKCADSLPLYRIEKRYERSGYPIRRSTLCALFHRVASILTPIYAALLCLAQNDPYVNADETTQPVNKEGGCKDGWIWTLVTKTVIAYFFSESRSGEIAKKLLEGTIGYLQVDGYSAYNAVCSTAQRIRVGCWSHARRLFFKSLKDFPQAKEVCNWIVDLYFIETKIKKRGLKGTEVHLQIRQEQSAAILKKIKEWLDINKPLHTPKSKIGKAIGYALNQWESLIVFTTDPRISLDNNVSERALRIIALGRNNFLFVGEDGCGQNLAILQTIVSTCKLHGINPYDYIKDVLIRIQSTDTKDVTPLLPQNWKQSS